MLYSLCLFYSTGTGGAILRIGGAAPLTTLGDRSTTTNPSFPSTADSSFGGGGGGAFGIGGTVDEPAGEGDLGIGETPVGLAGRESRFFFCSRSSSVRLRRAWRASSSAL